MESLYATATDELISYNRIVTNVLLYEASERTTAYERNRSFLKVIQLVNHFTTSSRDYLNDTLYIGYEKLTKLYENSIHSLNNEVDSIRSKVDSRNEYVLRLLDDYADIATCDVSSNRRHNVYEMLLEVHHKLKIVGYALESGRNIICDFGSEYYPLTISETAHGDGSYTLSLSGYQIQPEYGVRKHSVYIDSLVNQDGQSVYPKLSEQYILAQSRIRLEGLEEGEYDLYRTVVREGGASISFHDHFQADRSTLISQEVINRTDTSYKEVFTQHINYSPK